MHACFIKSQHVVLPTKCHLLHTRCNHCNAFTALAVLTCRQYPALPSYCLTCPEYTLTVLLPGPRNESTFTFTFTTIDSTLFLRLNEIKYMKWIAHFLHPRLPRLYLSVYIISQLFLRSLVTRSSWQNPISPHLTPDAPRPCHAMPCHAMPRHASPSNHNNHRQLD